MSCFCTFFRCSLPLFLLLAFGWSVQGQSPADIPVLKGKAASEAVPGAAVVRKKTDGEPPAFVRFRSGQEVALNQFPAWFKKQFGLGQAFDWKALDEFEGPLGNTHYRYRQTYQGVPVRETMLNIHVAPSGMVKAFNGRALASVKVPSSPEMNREDARDAALEHVGGEKYKWQLPEEEIFIKEETGDPDASFFPEGELLYTYHGARETQVRLAYQFNIYAHEPRSRSEVLVDAFTGEVLFENDLIHNADETGTAVTGYSGDQQIVADKTGPNSYRLRESGRGNGIETYDMNEGTNYSNAVDFTDDDNYWDNANADLDEYATDAHWGAEMTYDYYWQEHNRNSVDDNGMVLRSYVHYDEDYGNAFWDGQRMTYGDGNNNNPFTTLDITAHEVTHGVTTFTADLDYSFESGALNESFSDIFAAAVEFFAQPGSANWEIGEDIGGIRSMSDPNSYGDPDTYQGTNWHTDATDNGGVHTNSGVQNYWFYLLAEGGSGTNDHGDNYTVNGIGMEDAAAIAYRTLSIYLTPTSEYADARYYSIQAALDLFGPCTPQVEAATNAWYAVGVGDAYIPGVHSDLEASITADCQAPATIQFSNYSQNATDFTWAFGDGDSSQAFEPSHTYSAPGEYSVTLIADGGACGKDTLEEVDLISIGPSEPCNVVMDSSGVGPIQKNCMGYLYDSGGPQSNYPDQRDSYITISPAGASQVELEFSMFDVEEGSGSTCDYDYVEFFDGYDATAPSLGRYCNTTGTPGTIVSSDSAITVKLHSDQALNRPGFKARWVCNLPDAVPVADFTANDTVLCSGKVQFTDHSLHGPDSWLWAFGDGDSSTAQDPEHIYTQSGVYDVTLIVTDTNGSDTLTRSSYIDVNLPPAPTVEDTARCSSGPFDLPASATGTAKWYDTAVAGDVLDTGSVYTTPSISDSATYYVENVVGEGFYQVGPASNSFGTGGNFTYDQYLIFDCYQAVTLQTVLVYAQGTKNRTIELRDDLGNVLQDTTLLIEDGAQRITLNFELPVQNDLQLGVDGDGADLYRNDSGANYPYTISGVLSIKESSASTAPQDYYYFFYDWEVHKEGCTSARSRITARVNDTVDASITNAPDSLWESCSMWDLNAVDTGGTWSGPGIIDADSGHFDPGVAGVGSHDIVHSVTSPKCGVPITDTVTIQVDASSQDMITTNGPYCENGLQDEFSATISGGTWSGPGITNTDSGYFDPGTAGVGDHEITYTVLSSCGISDTDTVTVEPAPVATILTSPDTLCQDASPVTLNTVQSGGVWYAGQGVSGSQFDPGAVAPGSYVLFYFITQNGCYAQDSVRFRVEACTSVPSRQQKTTLKVYPDPTDGDLSLEMQSTEGWDEGRVLLLDAVGRVVTALSLAQGNAFHHSFDLHDQPAGVYWLRIRTDQEVRQRKVVLQ